MRPRVYIETTIPSFYHEDRTEAFAVARREWTRTWWDKRSHLYDLISSQAVLDELNEGDYFRRNAMIDEPTLEQIWEVRRKIYAQCGNDPQKLVAYFMERQKQNPQRLLQRFGDIQKWQEKSVNLNYSKKIKNSEEFSP